MKTNLAKHEIMGLLMLFLSGTLFGFGLYLTVWAAVRPLLFGSIEYMIKGKELLIFPLFFGVAFILWTLGHVELKWATPGKRP